MNQFVSDNWDKEWNLSKCKLYLYPRFLQYLNEYEAKDEEEKKAVQDLIFLTEMIIRSIELTMEG